MTTTVIRDKFVLLQSELNAETINRSEEIFALCVALVARAHMFMISKPGTGKTFLVDRAMMRIEAATKFSILLSKFTNDQEAMGPWSLPDLDLGVYRRLTKGYLPEADVVFIDEIWKGSSAFANLLLGATNERRIKDGANVIDIPLSTLFCASNELPSAEHGECSAIYDRIDLRLEVDDEDDPDDLFALLRLSIDPNPAPVLTWADVRVAQAAAAALPLTDDAAWALIAIKLKLKEAGLRVSGRRFRRAAVIAQAAAWLAGDDKVEVKHLEVLRHMFWDSTDTKAAVEKIVMEVASPLQKEALVLADDVTKLAEDLSDSLGLPENDPARTKGLQAVQKKSKRVMDKALDLEDQVSGRAAALLADSIDRIEKVHQAVAFDLAGVTGGKPLAEMRRDERR